SRHVDGLGRNHAVANQAPVAHAAAGPGHHGGWVMNQQKFDRLLDIYGADPKRWPPAERGAAEALLRQSPQAQRQFAAAQQLDAALDRVGPAVAAAQIDRVVEQAMAAVRFLPQDKIAARPALLPGLRAATARWLSAGVLSGAVAAGLAFGFLLQQPTQGSAVA